MSGQITPAGFAKLRGRLDALVAAGRLTPDEAARLRAAPDVEAAQPTLLAISARHARERADAGGPSG